MLNVFRILVSSKNKDKEIMNDLQKRKEDLEEAKGWLAIAKENDNKIAIQILEKFFPELRESEDERIRKEIISYIKSSAAVTNKDWIAWLEKQGEQKLWSDEDVLMIQDAIHWINEFQKSNKCKDENDMQNSITCENWLKSLKDRVLPQPKQEWSEEDERMHTIKVFYPSIGISVEEAIEKGIAYSKKEGDMLISINGIFLLVTQLSTVEKVMEEYNKCVGNCNDIKEKVNHLIQWTSDDEAYLKGVICDIECEVLFANCSRNIADMKINWLKSLKERVQPQPKQKWSEEDSAMMNLLIEELNSIAKHNGCLKQYEPEINWLKSLKPRGLIEKGLALEAPEGMYEIVA